MSISDINKGLSGVNPTGGGGTGTVTSVSVVTANGFAGSVATATTTPAITLSIAADLPMNGYKITGLGAPTSSTDAATKSYADGISLVYAIIFG